MAAVVLDHLGPDTVRRFLSDGTVLTTIVDANGFSDDNARGMVLSGMAITPANGGALAMYENYDDTPALRVAELEDLVTDPRLTWRTDPAVNQAGERIDVRRVDG